jgi:acetate kinase
VACFDTAFHRRLPEVAQRLPLPTSLWDRGVRRYGFHGLSYEYVCAAVDAPARGRVVVAHLGSGASMVALRVGAPIDTTMGLTPRAAWSWGPDGDLDPGVLLYLIEQDGYEAEALATWSTTRPASWPSPSGRATCGSCLLPRPRTPGRPSPSLPTSARCASTLRAGRRLGGLDLLVFTGGVGEHAPTVRADACATLRHLGIRLDPVRNEAGVGVISADGSPCEVGSWPRTRSW